jgi:hypothetical protein
MGGSFPSRRVEARSHDADREPSRLPTLVKEIGSPLSALREPSRCRLYVMLARGVGKTKDGQTQRFPSRASSPESLRMIVPRESRGWTVRTAARSSNVHALDKAVCNRIDVPSAKAWGPLTRSLISLSAASMSRWSKAAYAREINFCASYFVIQAFLADLRLRNASPFAGDR